MVGNALTRIISLLYPTYCVNCNVIIAAKAVLCDRCHKTVQPVVPLQMRLTKDSQMTVYAVSSYEEPLAQLVRAKKWLQVGAAHQLGQLVGHYLINHEIKHDFIIPIPLHWSRYACRGYNQAKIIATYVSRTLGVPVIEPFRRWHRTYYQVTLPREKRYHNVHGAFDVRWRWRGCIKEVLEGKHVLLVDDVCTTGATLQACARTLLAWKPAHVSAIVACRTLTYK